VLWHDPDRNRRQISRTEYSDLVDRDGNRAAALEDVLQDFGSRAFLDIEVKVHGHEESIVAALRKSPPQRGFIVSSFLSEALLRLHQLDGTLPLGFICDRREEMARWRKLPIKAFLPHHSYVNPDLIEQVHAHPMQIMTWTVNDASQMRQLAIWGIDGLISDDPKLLYQTFHIA